jgi:hypothetical protein
MDNQETMHHAQETGRKVFNEAFEYLGKATDTTVEMQREFLRMQSDLLKTWTGRWQGTNGSAGTAASAQTVSHVTDDMEKIHNGWAETIDHMLAKRREVLELQYRSAVEALEGAMRLTQTTSPEAFAEKMEDFYRTSLAAWQKSSEAQLKEFQDAAQSWMEMSSSFGRMEA